MTLFLHFSGKALAATALSGAEFTVAQRAISAGKVVVVFDRCYIGGTGQPRETGATPLKAGLPGRYYDLLGADRR